MCLIWWIKLFHTMQAVKTTKVMSNIKHLKILVMNIPYLPLTNSCKHNDSEALHRAVEWFYKKPNVDEDHFACNLSHNLIIQYVKNIMLNIHLRSVTNITQNHRILDQRHLVILITMYMQLTCLGWSLKSKK